MGKSGWEPSPKLHDLVLTAPCPDDYTFIFKWNNKTKSYDTFTFSESKAERRISRQEIEELLDKLKTSKIFMYNLNANFQFDLQAGVIFFGIFILCLLTLLRVLGLVGAVFWGLGIQVVIWAECILFPCLDRLLFGRIEKRSGQIASVVNKFQGEGSRSKRFKIDCASYGAYLEIKLEKIEPQYLLDVEPTPLEDGVRSQLLPSVRSGRNLNRVAPAPMDFGGLGGEDFELGIGNHNDIQLVDDEELMDNDLGLGAGGDNNDSVRQPFADEVPKQTELKKDGEGAGVTGLAGSDLDLLDGGIEVRDAEGMRKKNISKNNLEIQDILVAKNSNSGWDLNK